MKTPTHGSLTSIPGYVPVENTPSFIAARTSYEAQRQPIKYAQYGLGILGFCFILWALLWARSPLQRMLGAAGGVLCFLGIALVWLGAEYMFYNNPNKVGDPYTLPQTATHWDAMAKLGVENLFPAKDPARVWFLDYALRLAANNGGLVIADLQRGHYAALPVAAIAGLRELSEAEVRAQPQGIRWDAKIWNLQRELPFDLFPFHENDRFEERGPFAFTLRAGPPDAVWILRNGLPGTPTHAEFMAQLSEELAIAFD
jgi:hypothetical protein